MSAAAIAAIAVTGVLVLALAFYLLWVIVILRQLVDTLGKVTFGVAAISHRVSPVGPLVQQINTELTAVAETLEALVADIGQRTEQAS
ncbi:hypothetical protein BH18ACT8_BH18ACT8_01060 [soil metagenome]